MWIMTEKTQHDQIGIQTIKTVADVSIVSRLCFGLSNVFHDLVLTLTRDFMSGENDLNPLPFNVFCHFLADEIFQLFCEPCHELGSWCNTIAVKRVLLWQFNPFSDRLLASALSI